MHTRTWTVTVYLSEEGDGSTHARAVLHGEAPTTIEGRGSTRRNPHDQDIPEIGDEVAAARALRALAERLLDTASDDIAEVEHRDVHLSR